MNAITVINGQFTVTAPGIYIIRYNYTDNCGLAADQKQLNFTVLARPVIGDVIAYGDVETGAEVTVLPATATYYAPAEGTAAATVKVYFGDTELTVTDGKFVCTEAGQYKVVYSYTDELGVSAEEKTYTFTVTVPKTDDKPKGNCKKSSQAPAAALLIFGGLFVVICKRKSKS